MTYKTCYFLIYTNVFYYFISVMFGGYWRCCRPVAAYAAYY